MSTDITTSEARGLARRTVLKASAWSVPVIAVAVATPMAAASTAVDLELRESAGDGLTGFSPDRLRAYTLSIASEMRARVIGTTPTAVGSTLTLSYDNRLMDDPSVEIGSTAAIAQSPTVNGNTTTVTFTLPVPIPTAEPGVMISVGFAVRNAGDWYEDIEPYSIMLLPPGGSDSNSSNNAITATARYVDTIDADVSATWRPVTIVDGNGNGRTSNVVESVTVAALTPGDIPSGGSVSIGGPSASDGLVDPYESIPTITGITVASALLDGVDVSDLIGTPSAPYFSVPVNTAIPAGQSLVLDLDVAVINSTPGWVWPGGYTQFNGDFSGGPDRDTANDKVQAPDA